MWNLWKWTYDIWIHFALTLLTLTVEHRAMSALPLYLALVGGRVDLPCDLNVSSSEDEVSLVLWHKDESSSPVYSVDARDTPLPAAKHFLSNDVINRAYFNSSFAPAFLRLEGVKKTEEGFYRCRVEYRRARTVLNDMILKVIVPPKEAIIMDEFGQRLRGVVGPLNEGHPLSLACEGEGGDPSPSVRWWRGSDLLDDSYALTAQGFARNELLLSSLRRSDLMSTLICKISNSNLTEPVTSSVTLDMNLVPTSVRITSMYRPLYVDNKAEIVCIAKGARPPAQISWWIERDQIKQGVTESSSREENLTVSTLTIIPSSTDDQKNLTCRADNPQIPSVVLEDVWLLNIHYIPKLGVSFNHPNPVAEGDDVIVVCTITSNPPISELEWLRDGKMIEKATLIPQWDHQTTVNRTFGIPSAGPEHKGRYQCAGTNSEGRAISESVQLWVHYTPRCQSVRSRVYGVGETESVGVVCEIDAEPSDVTFFWMLNNSISASALSSLQYQDNGSRSIATLSPRSPQDYGVLYCWAKNAIGKQREPCSFRIVPAGRPEKPKNCRISNETQQCTWIECDRGEDGGMQQLFQLEVYEEKSNVALANITAQKEPFFTLCHLPSRQELIFVLYSVNNKGRSKQVAVRSSVEGTGKLDGGSGTKGTIGVIIGVIIGIMSVLVLMAIAAVVFTRFKKNRLDKDPDFSPEADKCESHLMKDCKDSGVTGSQGPDIIPEKGFFRGEEIDFDIPSAEREVIVSIPRSTIDSGQGYDYQIMPFTADSREFISTPKRLRLLQDMEADAEESGITVETPLISTIPLAAQQWTDHRQPGMRLSTPV